MSVVVPVYGVEAYLTRCLDTLLNQTYRDLEILLVDDGSPDACGEICDAYAARDPRVTVIHQDNAGVSAARNRGLGQATGEFLMFVDPDDWIDPDLVRHLVDIAGDTGADLSLCGFLRVSEAGDITEGRAADTADHSVRLMTGAQALHLYAGSTAGLMTAPWGKLYRRELLDDVRFPVGRRYEDDFTTYRIVARARQVALSERPLYFYFIRPSSATQQPQPYAYLVDRIDALIEQGDFFEARGVLDAAVASRRKAFLLLRKVRPEIAGSGRGDLRRSTWEQTLRCARALSTPESPVSLRAFVRAYVLAPWLIDALIKARGGLSTKLHHLRLAQR